MSFSDAFETPVKIHANGHGDIELKKLTTRDYLPWLDELTASQRERETANIPPNTRPDLRVKIVRNIQQQEVTPDELSYVVFTARGTLKVLDLALTKHGISDEAERNKIMDARGPKDNEMIAARVCGLFTTERLNEMYGPLLKAENPPEASGPNPTAA